VPAVRGDDLAVFWVSSGGSPGLEWAAAPRAGHGRGRGNDRVL